MMHEALGRRTRRFSTVLVFLWLGWLLLAPATVSHGQQGAQSPASPNEKVKVPPDLLKKWQDLVDQGKITPEEMKQAADAVEKGEMSVAEARKLVDKELAGSLTREDIDKGKKLLEERTKKAAPAVEAGAKAPEPEKKAEPIREEPAKKEEVPVQPEFRIFGHELFSKPPSTFAPITQLPVSDEYVIGPGDEIKVLMWGRIDADYSLNVDNEGVISSFAGIHPAMPGSCRGT